jgi:hypothetical protein
VSGFSWHPSPLCPRRPGAGFGYVPELPFESEDAALVVLDTVLDDQVVAHFPHGFAYGDQLSRKSGFRF